MLPTKPEGYVSIVASNFVFPIVSLFESLDSLGTHAPNEVQTSPLENGYSLAIITLTVLLIESAISRTQYMMKRQLGLSSRISRIFHQKSKNSSSYVTQSHTIMSGKQMFFGMREEALS